MDVCHLILGRPWQFDAGAMYDCRANIYSLEWKGRRLRLLPHSNENKTTAGSSNQTALHIVSGAMLIQSWKEPAPMYALVLAEQSVTSVTKNWPGEILELLQQYKGITPEHMPPGLPPLREIQHNRFCDRCQLTQSSALSS
ncbi:hypothetical protein MA16_Dca015051 [Dendrobium catenatum]|uniref:Uncharacterized protein n=1 Tax=Dendrobium catenatum TaxID=906689 RepID=A0A2I0VTP7_9ASPA|nr:hypothetical protein MA16_Dca015051 [Dendrobium catenatum]